MLENFAASVSDATAPANLGWIALRLILALVAGCAVAWLAKGRQNDQSDGTLPITLVLMSVLIAMATQIIGDNIARAFSLVGALSIVRFRTAVPQTQDVAFVLSSVVVGMAIGAGQFAIAALGLAIVGCVVRQAHLVPCLGQSKAASNKCNLPSTTSMELMMTVGLSAATQIEQAISQVCQTYSLRGIETARKGAALKVSYSVVLAPGIDAPAAVVKLQQMNAVETVELRL